MRVAGREVMLVLLRLVGFRISEVGISSKGEGSKEGWLHSEILEGRVHWGKIFQAVLFLSCNPVQLL